MRGSWMPAQSRSPGQVATPCFSGSGCPYAALARATHCGPLPTAVSLSTPLTRSDLALVFQDYWKAEPLAIRRPLKHQESRPDQRLTAQRA